jgi:repressor LexA
MLTKKQYELLVFINNSLNENGVCPSFQEMSDACHVVSKSGIHRLIGELVARGFVRRLKYRARAIEIIKLPDNLSGPRPVTAKFTPCVVEGDFSGRLHGAQLSHDAKAEAISIPLYGPIKESISAEEFFSFSSYIEVPASMLVADEECFAMTLNGNFAEDAGFQRDDILLFVKAEEGESGKIVLVSLENKELRLRKIRRLGNATALESIAFGKPRIFPPNMMKIQGRLIGLMRTYD